MPVRAHATTLFHTTLVALLLVAVPAGPANAADPPASEVTVPSRAGQTATVEWTGTSPPGAVGAVTNDCTVDPTGGTVDTHTVTVTVPEGLDPSLVATFAFHIEWDDDVQDLVLTVQREDGTEVASSDGGSPEENVVVQDLASGTYLVSTCAFLAVAPTDYRGSLTIRVDEGTELPKPAPARRLEFSASVPADLQRDEGEPLIDVDPAGRIYVCGPTGFSQANDYWQVSTDGGDQFHLLGQSPRGQVSGVGGGGDCAMAFSPEPNDEGFHRLSYVGLTGLLEFTTANSDDGGHTIQPFTFSLVGQAVDRQWTVATSEDDVFLNFNRIAPTRQVEVCHSTDGGLTYPSCQAVSPNPGFPGPMRAIPPEHNPTGNGEWVVYYPWTQGTAVRLAVSLDGGDTWNNCTAAEAQGAPDTLFPVMDHDEAGNLYLAYVDQGDYNAYFTWAPLDVITDCTGGTSADDEQIKDNPGFRDPVLVNGSPVATATHPWIVASGQPGRVAITFYGTQTSGPADGVEPRTRTWHVYVNQSLNALDANPRFSQVRATSHPNHYDQICLLGLACTAGGDRSLVDFFAIDLHPDTGELLVVYQQAHKRPGDFAGSVATPVVVRQRSGPSLLGGSVDTGPPTVRTASTDPTDDALADYSALLVTPTPTNVRALDLLGHEVGPELDLAGSDDAATADQVADGGFTVTLQVADLSDTALEEALAITNGQSLLWLFRYVDGFRYGAAVAAWNPAAGFTVYQADFEASPQECGLIPGFELPEGLPVGNDQCLYYRPARSLDGVVDQEAGTITISVPRDTLVGLSSMDPGPGQTPEEVPAGEGTRIFDSAAFTQVNGFSPDQAYQAFLVPIDNTPAMDFVIPVQRPGRGGPGGPGGGPGGGASSEPPLPATGTGMIVPALLGFVLAWSLRPRRR